jgi:hypothetical protein
MEHVTLHLTVVRIVLEGEIIQIENLSAFHNLLNLEN